MGSVLAEFDLFHQRRTGILLHPSSLPGPGECGTLGEAAYRFVDFLQDAGLSVWQTLPLGPTHSDLSPYQSLSSHAGNPRLICPEWLVQQQWLPISAMPGSDESHSRWLARAAAIFAQQTLPGNNTLSSAYRHFCQQQQHWLEDYTLFQTLREHLGFSPWNQWPAIYRHREPRALEQVRTEHCARLEQHRFEQFAFFSQWHALRDYAHQRGVYLFGDIPIFVAHDSADVWANQSQFMLDEEGSPLTVAGVPPDYFSETGQHWGNPHYRWDLMQGDGFRWWLARIESQLALFDLVRIDHFRGLEAFWEIPANAPDARSGRWVKAPGRALLDTLFSAFNPLPLVAENLGVITPEVEALRQDYQLPGMLVLQFAFDGSRDNPHLPANHLPLDVVYTGTHDNDTSLGWYQSLADNSRHTVDEYLAEHRDLPPWNLIRAALASPAQLAIVPLQDFLALGKQHRMNLPGTMCDDNWRWRFQWQQFPEGLASKIRLLNRQYQRLVDTGSG